VNLHYSSERFSAFFAKRGCRVRLLNGILSPPKEPLVPIAIGKGWQAHPGRHTLPPAGAYKRR